MRDSGDVSNPIKAQDLIMPGLWSPNGVKEHRSYASLLSIVGGLLVLGNDQPVRREQRAVSGARPSQIAYAIWKLPPSRAICWRHVLYQRRRIHHQLRHLLRAFGVALGLLMAESDRAKRITAAVDLHPAFLCDADPSPCRAIACSCGELGIGIWSRKSW